MGIESLVGSIFGGSQAEDAEDAQYAAVNRSDALTRETRDLIRADNKPFLEAGYQANDLLRALMTSGQLKAPTFQQYQRDPSYQWQQNEGARITQNSAAASGGLYSGRTLKALQDRSQNIANADYGNWWNREQQGASNQVNLLSAIRSGGQAAAGAMGSASQNAVNALSNSAYQQGNAKAAELSVQGNLFGNAMNRMSSYGQDAARMAMGGGFF
jgi:hypothetical protein